MRGALTDERPGTRRVLPGAGLWTLAGFALTRQPAAMGHSSGPGMPGELIRLDRAESLRLMAGVPVGRLIFTINSLPAVRPMNFALVDQVILLRTAPGTTAARKIHDMIVAFEADELDAATSSGWSVTVTGRATLVTDPQAIARYQTVPLMPWAPGAHDQFMTITTELIEGRRIRSSPAVSMNPAAAH